MSDPVIEVSVDALHVDVAAQEPTVEVQHTGQMGPAGPANLFIQNAVPVTVLTSYLWVQTGLGAGTDLTFWVEDGLA